MIDIDLDMIIKVASFIGIPSIFLLLTYLFKGISLAQVTPFERHLMNDTKKMISGFLESLFPAIILGILLVVSLEVIDEFSFYTNLLIGTFPFIGMLIVDIILNSRFSGKESYYLIENGQKIFIHKITSEGDIVLSNEKIISKYSVYIIQKKEFLYGKEIKVEHIDMKEPALPKKMRN
ncbi:hypothetical protein J27TS7_02940 [Paenibacillus dendritiformis]|uniref:hypothetical protein n=1 Tax=Paenibacillus dendritiformis TaxID=130049 RepID=UPI00143D19F4|nr:hypothetical protein [Paenibacillus dendritiformis]NKI19806.1 hypothetical protein [Paenibacillus dendritiformis]NRF99924.1 hypothetical protein [Paenibacillus dendritiformis]GIO70780.1 hypothetical protein J27TS7_02940 [Paenibacillus dendritiformis]